VREQKSGKKERTSERAEKKRE